MHLIVWPLIAGVIATCGQLLFRYSNRIVDPNIISSFLRLPALPPPDTERGSASPRRSARLLRCEITTPPSL